MCDVTSRRFSSNYFSSMFSGARAFLSGVLLLLFAVPAAAQPGPLSGFSFLRLEPSARAAALGGSLSAVHGDDVNVLFYNPSLLNETMHGGLSISYLNHLSDVQAGFVAYGHEVPGVGSLAAGLRFLSWGSTKGADADGTETGDFRAGDVALTVGGGRAVGERLMLGGNVHAVYSTLAEHSASALAVDAGVAYRLPDQNLTFSSSVNNLGATLSSLGATRDELPLDVRVGVSKRLQHVPLLISVTGYNLHEAGAQSSSGPLAQDVLHHLIVGGEFQFSEAFNLRFGYNHRRHEALKMKSRLDLAGFAAGFGLKIAQIRFDYALNSWSSSGALHQVTIRTSI